MLVGQQRIGEGVTSSKGGTCAILPVDGNLAQAADLPNVDRITVDYTASVMGFGLTASPDADDGSDRQGEKKSEDDSCKSLTHGVPFSKAHG